MTLPGDEHWEKVKEYARNCPWAAGAFLAKLMDEQAFTDWERVIMARDRNGLTGFCTVSKQDCIPGVDYTPYIGFVFVDESKRGSRLSQHMIEYAMHYLRGRGFDKVYMVSDHENLYEKYGFQVIDHGIAPWGCEEQIFMQSL